GYISRQLGISIEELKEANYALLDPVWRGAARVPAGYVLRVPVHYQERLDRLVTPEPGAPKSKAPVQVSASNVYGGVTYRVRKGDTVSSIAKKYRTTAAKIVALNRLPNANIKIGQVLVVKEQEHGKRDHAPTLSREESAQSSVVKKT